MNNRAVSVILTGLSFLSVFRAAAPAKVQSGNHAVTAKHESPFACNMNALSDAERKRHFEELGPQLRSMKKGVRELKNGYEIEFSSDRKTYDLVSEWAIQESLCCPFFRIAVRLESEGGPLWLQLTGRPGTKEFIQDEFTSWMKD